MLQQHWLLALPRTNLKNQEKILAEWLAADPAAAAIADEEAETFIAACYMLLFMHSSLFARVCQACGVRMSHGGEKAMRQATVRVLRRWKQPKVRDFLVSLMPDSCFGRFPDPATRGHVWTEEFFAEAYQARLNIVWLVQVRRYLGKAANLVEWLKGLDEFGPRYYKMWVNVGRLSLRRIVYPELGPKQAEQEAAAALHPELADELREKDRLSGALRQDVRRLEQDRRKLKERARRAGHEARAVLPQARGEVEAARRALREQRAAQERELAEQARKFEGELAALRARMAGVHGDFVRRLAEVSAKSRVDLLRGRSVTVVGGEGDRGVYRLLVESIGGRLLPEGGEVVLEAAEGYAAFDRKLRSLVLDRVLVKCDGLYRRKDGRHGIAISGFQVQIGDWTAFENSSVVCCGPSAGSLMAEYGAAAMALSWLLAAGPPPGAKLVIWTDCKALLSRVVRRRSPRRKLGCVTLDKSVRRLVSLLKKRGCDVWFRWVPRDEVHAVDRLCDRAYREQMWYHKRNARPSAPLQAFLAAVRQPRRPA